MPGRPPRVESAYSNAGLRRKQRGCADGGRSAADTRHNCVFHCALRPANLWFVTKGIDCAHGRQ
jgi:hypothetical protein